MSKKDIDRLEGLLADRQKQTNKNLVAFLATKEEIKMFLDKGHDVKAIWHVLKETGSIQFGYVQFTTYVNRHILDKEKTPMKEKVIAEPEIEQPSFSRKKESDLIAEQYESTNPLLKNLGDKS